MERLKTIPDTNEDNALFLGLGLHKGIETGSAELGVEEYKSHYNILTDENINYIIQLEYQIPKVIELLPTDGEHELEIDTDDFKGYIDYVCGDTLFDFKFSNNIDRYKTSPQLSIYKYYLELVRPDIKINHLKYVFVPKIQIRQKKTETIQQFRTRLRENLLSSEIKIVEVSYNRNSIAQFQQCCQQLNEQLICADAEYPKNPTRLCAWCPYVDYCKSNGQLDYMILKIKQGEENYV